MKRIRFGGDVGFVPPKDRLLRKFNHRDEFPDLLWRIKVSNKFFKFGLMALLSLGMAACDDDSNDDKGGDATACSANETKCDGDFVMVCSGGSWQKNATACPNGCEAGACKTNGSVPGTSVVCTENDKRCNGENLETCISNTWTSSKCDNGCDTTAKACKVAPGATVVCTENDARCNGENLETCINNTWQSNKCDNGCDTAKKACKAAPTQPDPGESCTDGATKCDADFVLTCKNKAWQKNATACPFGCDNGACKQENATTTKDAYCEGSVLHYKDSDGKDASSDCTKLGTGFECQKLKDGTSDCVIGKSEASKVCAVEGDIYGGVCREMEGTYAVFPIKCAKNEKDELVGVPGSLTISACGTSEGKKVALICDPDDSGKYVPSIYECKTSCTEADYVATCDGEDVMPLQKDEYVVCDDKCVVEGGQKCTDACKAEGYNYCYVNYATNGVQCSKEEVDPTTLGGDDDYDPFDLMDCDDYGCMIDENTTCSSKCDKYCYVTISKNEYSCSDEELTAVGHNYWYCGDQEMSDSSGKKDLLDNLCAAESANTIGICDGVNPGCLEKCSSKGGTQAACLDSDSMSASYNLVCSDIDGKLAYTPDLTSLSKCASTCNEAGTACK